MIKYLGKSYIYNKIYKARTLYFYNRVLKKQFASIGGPPVVWGAWNIEVYGPNISIGKNVVLLAADDARIRLNTAQFGHIEGTIDIGSNVLVMSGVRISSASKIVIGDDCMLANFCYLTDADWHDLHDRTMPIGKTQPIILEKGVWVGDSAIVCKGVHIGRNTIIGAGSVVSRSFPANVIVAGNPARIVKKLDPKRIVTMGALFDKLGR